MTPVVPKTSEGIVEMIDIPETRTDQSIEIGTIRATTDIGPEMTIEIKINAVRTEKTNEEPEIEETIEGVGRKTEIGE